MRDGMRKMTQAGCGREPMGKNSMVAEAINNLLGIGQYEGSGPDPLVALLDRAYPPPPPLPAEVGEMVARIKAEEIFTVRYTDEDKGQAMTLCGANELIALVESLSRSRQGMAEALAQAIAVAEEVVRLDEEGAGLAASDGLDVVNLTNLARVALARTASTGEEKGE
jgi:hypothetical protein